MRTVYVLPSQSFASQMPALPKGEPRSRSKFLPSAQSNLSLPLGEMSRSDREGWNQLTWLFKFALIRTCLRAALSAICFTNASSPKGRAEKPVRIFCLTHKPNLSLPLGEMSRSDREGWNQLTWLFKFALTRAFLFCAQTKTEHLPILCLLVEGGGFAFLRKSHAGCNMHPACCQEPAFESTAPILNLEGKIKESTDCTLFFGGRWWIRTTEVVDNRFTVCPLWPLGKPPIFTCRNRGAGGRT